MLVISVLVISVCAAAFSKSGTYSRNAKRLSDAVTLAASGAEVFLAAQTQEEMLSILNEADNASAGEADEITARYNDNLEPAADGNMEMVIDWDESDGFAHGTITVYYGNEKIYDLETGAAKDAQTSQGADK